MKQNLDRHIQSKHPLLKLPDIPLYHKNPRQCRIAPTKEANNYKNCNEKDTYEKATWTDPILAEKRAKELGGQQHWRLKIVITEEISRSYHGNMMEWLLQNDIGMYK